MMRVTVDGNEAAASVAYRLNEVCCIYPITPSSPMAELADEWSSQGGPTSGAACPAVVEMQSEGGAAGALARRAAGRGAGDDLHRLAGPAADDPEHVQDRRRADAGGAARRRPLAGRPGAVDLRRPLRRDGRAADRLRAAGLGVGAGGARPGAGGARRDAGHPGAVRAFLRRLPHLARAEHDRAAVRRRPARARARGAGPRAPRPGAVARAPVHPRHRAEPGRLLPGARDRQPVLRRACPAWSQDAMDRLAERTGRRYQPRRLHRPPRGRAGDRGDGLGARDRRARPSAHLCARGERVGVVQVRLYRPFPARALLAALPASVAPVAVLDRTKEPGSLGEPLFLDVVAALAEAHADGERAVHAAGDRRPLRPVLEGVHAGHGRRGVRGAGPRAAAAPLHGRHQRRRLGHEPAVRPVARHRAARTRCGRCSSASARTGRSAPTRTRSRSSAPRRTCTPRATSSTTRRSPARRRSRTCASGRSRSERRTWSRRPASSAATSFGLLERAEVLDRAAPGATLLLNAPHPPDEVWDALPAPGPGADPRQADRAVRDRRRPDRPRGRPGRAHQHRAADLLLRHLRRTAARRGDRQDQGGDRQDLRPPRRRGRRAKPGGGRPGARGPAPGRAARPGDLRPRACPPWCPRTRRSSSAPSPPR